MRLRSCLMMVSMSFCLSLSVFLNWAKTLFFLLVSLILEMDSEKVMDGEKPKRQDEEGNCKDKEKSVLVSHILLYSLCV